MGTAVLILPAFDEAASLPGVLAEVRRVAPRFEVLVIDDGSRDDTAAAARLAGVRVVRHPFNLGYGAALQTGYKWALAHDAELLVQMDADGQHLPSELAGLVAPIERGECDLVVGSRFLGSGQYRMGVVRSLGRNLFRALARSAGLAVTDPTSGFQAMNRRTLEFLAGDWFPTDYPDVDVLLCAVRAGLRVREHPVRMAQGARPSTLHSGWKPLYYSYKMLLSMWAASGRRR